MKAPHWRQIPPSTDFFVVVDIPDRVQQHYCAVYNTGYGFGIRLGIWNSVTSVGQSVVSILWTESLAECAEKLYRELITITPRGARRIVRIFEGQCALGALAL